MNKYQEFLIGKCFRRFDRNNRKYLKFVEENDKIILEQDENIELVDYNLTLSNIYVETIEKILILKNDKWKEVETNETISINLNFLDKTQQIKFVFKNNIADDYVVDIEYIEANKEIYFAKKEQEHKESLLKTANIKVSTGVNLVNIYFQPCSDKYARAEIILYKDNMMLAKYKVDEETFFKSITGLANGKYSFVLKQYDNNSSIILETNNIDFIISTPRQQVIGHVNRI